MAATDGRVHVWTPRQLWSRIGGIVGVGALVVVLHFTGLLDRMQRRLFPQPVDWKQDYSVVEHLRDLVLQDGLTHDARQCLLFVINGNDPPQSQRIQVWEKHSGACPGKRGETPVLFTLRVDRDHHAVATDQGSPGQFRSLQ